MVNEMEVFVQAYLHRFQLNNYLNTLYHNESKLLPLSHKGKVPCIS